VSLLRLPGALRAELKAPMGPVFTDADALLAEAGRPVVGVGDVVTRHLLGVETPRVALVDGRTEREDLAEPERPDLAAFDRRERVDNPAATLSAALLRALGEALAGQGTTAIVVDGEEDLAALPAILAAPEGATVVYGQPGEGMVRVAVDAAARERARDLLERMDGDSDAALEALGVDTVPDADS
jgi:uncharacterized protein (UPF0218 family)